MFVIHFLKLSFQFRQECIPVGCAPPALYRGGFSVQGWEGSLSKRGLSGGSLSKRGVSVQERGLCPRGGSLSGRPSVNRTTQRCKNITLPQNSFAGGKKNSQKRKLALQSCAWDKTVGVAFSLRQNE